MNDVIGDEMEETYDEAAIFWQGLKRELAQAVSEKMVFLKQQGVEEDDLDLSSEEEGLESESDLVEDSDTESVTARRRYDNCRSFGGTLTFPAVSLVNTHQHKAQDVFAPCLLPLGTPIPQRRAPTRT